MAEIEYVPRASVDPGEDILHLPLDVLEGGEKDGRVEITLYGGPPQ